MKRLMLIITVCAVGMTANVLAASDNRPQAIDHVEVTTGPSVQGGTGRIVFSSVGHEATFRVYSITGQLLKIVKVLADQTVSAELPKGFYIVKCGDQWSRKVVVK